MGPAPIPIEHRFWDKLDMSGGPDACWEWQARRDRDGYGQAWVDRTTMGAHRVAWELTHGPIPDGIHVLHRCDNPPCCNPAHLFLGTQKDNQRDKWSKGRGVQNATHGEKSPLAKLTDNLVRLIRASPLSVRALARLHGISKSTVQWAKSGKSWKHVR